MLILQAWISGLSSLLTLGYSPEIQKQEFVMMWARSRSHLHSKVGPIFLSAIISASLVLGCESKVKEREAGTQSVSSDQNAKIFAQEDLDLKISQFQGELDDLEALLKEIQKALPHGKLEAISVFDVIYKVNETVRKRTARLNEKGLTYNGSFNIKSSLLDLQCQSFQYVVRVDQVIPLDEVKYSLRSCATAGVALEVLTVTFEGGRTNLHFNQENFHRVLPIQSVESHLPECQFSHTSGVPTVCTNLTLAKTEALIWTANLTSLGRTSVQIKGRDRKTGNLVYQGVIEISEKGVVEKVVLDGPLEQ